MPDRTLWRRQRRRLLRRLPLLVLQSAVVGLLAGGAAILFIIALEAVGTLVGVLGGPVMPRPAGEWELFTLATAVPLPWLIVLLPALGGLISGLLVWKFAPEAAGHGTDAMIRAFHREDGLVRGRVPLVKGLATVAVIATGGSAGREGPIIHIGAGLGSWLAQRLHLDARRRRTLLLAGVAGGLGAVFRSPLGGALTAIEVLYREDFESEALVPAVVSSVSAYALVTTLFTHRTIFTLAQPPVFADWRELGYYLMLALAAAAMGMLFIRVFRGTRALFARLPLWGPLKPALGGLLAGAIGLLLPQTLGSGWGELQRALLGEYGVMAHGALLLLVVATVKIFTTSLTVGSGGSGGIFGPSLFIGGMLGAALGQALHALHPAVVPDPAAFALVGMAAFFAGIANAPLGALVMITELSGSYGLIAPLMFVCVFALLATRRWSIFEHQVRTRYDSPAHRAELLDDPLIRRRVRDLLPLLPPAPAPVAATASAAELRARLQRQEEEYLLVQQADGTTGIIESERLLAVADGSDGFIAHDLAEPLPVVVPEATLRTALRAMVRGRVGHALVAVAGAAAPVVLAAADIELALAAETEAGQE